jgi:hypothetical protein
MLRLVLEQVVNDPCGGNVVTLTRGVEVLDRHRTKPVDQDLPNGGQTSEVDGE